MKLFFALMGLVLLLGAIGCSDDDVVTVASSSTAVSSSTVTSSSSAVSSVSSSVDTSSAAAAASSAAAALPGLSYRDMVTVPGGTFTQQGTDGSSFSHTITGFKMGKYEVTYELWYTVKTWAAANGYLFANAGREGNDGIVGAAPTSAKYEPVTTINWRDAIVWCNAYSQMDGKTPVYCSDSGYTTPIKNSQDGSYTSSVNTSAGSFDNPYVNLSASGYRLPSEGQWQYAASYKDGSTWTPYSWASGATGDYKDAAACAAVAVYNGSVTQEVGTKTANLLGIYDMSGNVYEWCWDWYGTLPTTAQTDYRQAVSGSRSRVMRGGSYDPVASYLLTTYLQVGFRYYYYPYYESICFGFRVSLP